MVARASVWLQEETTYFRVSFQRSTRLKATSLRLQSARVIWQNVKQVAHVSGLCNTFQNKVPGWDVWGLLLYRIQAYQGYNGSADDPVGELEVWVPLVYPGLEPAKGLPVTQKGKEGEIFCYCMNVCCCLHEQTHFTAKRIIIIARTKKSTIQHQGRWEADWNLKCRSLDVEPEHTRVDVI